MSQRVWHGALHLAPLAGRGRRALARRVRGSLRESEPVESPPHPDPLPASGERGKKPPCHLRSSSPQGGGERRRRIAVTAASVAAAVLAAAGAIALWIVLLGPPPLGEGLEFSTTVVDREGRLLRPYATPEGRWRLPAQADGVDPRYLALLIAYEDKRFRDHSGVDPLALLRAGGQVLIHGRILSGGSTLTMQVARLLEPRAERSLAAKLRQIVRAMEIERQLTKDEVLTLYLSLAPYGGNLEGIRAASLAYFGKEPKRLTLGEAALLVALPQSPEARRPDRSVTAAARARDRVLDRVAEAGIFDAAEIAHAKAEPMPAHGVVVRRESGRLPWAGKPRPAPAPGVPR